MNKYLLIAVTMQVACSDGESGFPQAETSQADSQSNQISWGRLDTLAVLGAGPEWDESPLYRVSDAVLDNERNTVFLVNGGNSELIRYDISTGQIRSIGRRGRGPGEFGRPLWMEPHGPDSLLVYDRDLTQFSVFSSSGDFGRTFRVPGIGLRGRQPAALTRMGTGLWVAISSGLPQVLMVPETPAGTKARDTLTIVTVTDEGHLGDTVARVPHALWERLPDPTSFNIRRDEDAGGAMISGGGGRLFVAAFADSLEVFEYRVANRPNARLNPLAVGAPRQSVSQVFASRDGTLWIGEDHSASESTVFHVFRSAAEEWVPAGSLTLDGSVRMLDAAGTRIVLLHRDSLGIETVVVARASGSR